MATKQVIRYHEASAPIRSLTTKFGGQPVWLGKPTWPLSRLYGTPMQFICQLALDSLLVGAASPQMAYLFLTDDVGEGVSPNTFDPEGGENAFILQPGPTWPGPTQPMPQGPSLYRRSGARGHWEQTPCEYGVDLLPGSDPDGDAYERAAEEIEASDTYWDALQEEKIGGTPVPTSDGVSEIARLRTDGWRLLLQLKAHVNADDPFFLNFAWDGVGYAFLSPDGTAGKFLWMR